MQGNQKRLPFFVCNFFRWSWSSITPHPGFLKANNNSINRYTIKFNYFQKVCYLFFGKCFFIIVYLICEKYVPSGTAGRNPGLLPGHQRRYSKVSFFLGTSLFFHFSFKSFARSFEKISPKEADKKVLIKINAETSSNLISYTNNPGP